MKMLDLQTSRYARPTIDLVYFLGASTDSEFRGKHLDEILTFYHDMLMGFLKMFGYTDNIYTYADFTADFNDCFPFGYCLALVHALVS